MKVATWQGGSRFSVDEAPEPAPGTGASRGRGPHRGDLRHRCARDPGALPVEASPRDGTRVQRRDRRRGPAGREDADRACRGLRARLGMRRVPRMSGTAREPLPPDLTRAGGFAERVVLPTSAVHALPESLDPVTAAMTEPAACCLAGLETFRMPKGATVLVLGGGIMGLLTMAIAKRRGAARAILSDPIAERRDVARRLGADHVIDPTQDEPARSRARADERTRRGRGLRGGRQAGARRRDDRAGEAEGHRAPRGREPEGPAAADRSLRLPLPGAQHALRLRPRHELPPRARAHADARRERARHRAIPAGPGRGGLRARGRRSRGQDGADPDRRRRSPPDRGATRRRHGPPGSSAPERAVHAGKPTRARWRRPGRCPPTSSSSTWRMRWRRTPRRTRASMRPPPCGPAGTARARS